MRSKRKPDRIEHIIGKWFAEIFVKNIRRLRIEEAATMSRDIKGAKIVAFSSSGKALDALVVRGH